MNNNKKKVILLNRTKLIFDFKFWMTWYVSSIMSQLESSFQNLIVSCTCISTNLGLRQNMSIIGRYTVRIDVMQILTRSQRTLYPSSNALDKSVALNRFDTHFWSRYLPTFIDGKFFFSYDRRCNGDATPRRGGS